MLDMKHQREKFKDHVATFQDLGNIKIIDFAKPGTSDYRIRFLFEEDHYVLHISGDIGELIASNFNNMRFDTFGSHFTNNPDYFEEKVDCHSRDFYEWDISNAKSDLHDFIDQYDMRESILETKEEWDAGTDDDAFIDDYIDECLEDFDPYHGGMGYKGVEKAEELYSDFWEVSQSIGCRRTGVIELYLLAYKLAIQQLKENKVI